MNLGQVTPVLKAGKRVGVASNSHSAINNLLKEVEVCAAEGEFRFTGAKKGSGKLTVTYDTLDQLDAVLARLMR